MPKIQKVQRRTAPGEEPAPLPPEDDSAEGVEIAAKGELLDYLGTLSPAECQQREVWIYRRKPGESNKKPRRMEICPLPTDGDGYANLEEYVQGKYGGADYEIYLKVKGVGGKSRFTPNDHHGWLYLDGPPKMPYPDDPPTLSAATGQPVAPGQPIAQGDAVVMRAFDELRAARSNPIQQVGETIKVMKDLREELAPTKEGGSSMTGSALFDKLVVNAVERMANPPAPPTAAAPADPLEQLTKSIEAAEKLRALLVPAAPATAIPPRRENPGLLSGFTLRDAVELANGGQGDLVRELVLGPQEKPGFGEAAAAFGLKLIEARPDLVSAMADSLMNLLGRIGSAPEDARRNAQRNAQPAPAPAPAPTAAVLSGNQSGTQPGVQPAVPASPVNQEAMIEQLLAMIARAFGTNSSGYDTAAGIDTFFPEAVPQLQSLFSSQPDEQILAWLRTQPVLAAVIGHPEWLQFFADFKAAILAGFGQGDEGGEGPVTAGQAQEQPAGVS